jgi:hypothetical protein
MSTEIGSPLSFSVLFASVVEVAVYPFSALKTSERLRNSETSFMLAVITMETLR